MRRSLDSQSVMNRILLRFRPIAPKPAGGGDGASGAGEQERESGAWRRAKRKYVRVRGRRGKQCPRTRNSPPPENSGVEDEPSPEKSAATLQLLPERSEPESAWENRGDSNNNNNNNTDPCGAEDDSVSHGVTAATADLRSAGSAIETWVIVERVTDRFADAQVGLGFSDEEWIHGMERDTCPGFISDRENKVVWVNEAYRRMVAAAEEGFQVRLVVEDELPPFCPSFACRVRVIRRRGQGQNWNKIVPCDVWRMEFAGLAWKLDVNTALSLSL